MNTHEFTEKKNRRPITCPVILLVLLLSFASINGCSINWEKEWQETHWAKDTGRPFGLNGRDNLQRPSKFATAGVSIYQNKLVSLSPLSEAGLDKMATQGCTACHKDGGLLPSQQLADLYLIGADSRVAAVYHK